MFVVRKSLHTNDEGSISHHCVCCLLGGRSAKTAFCSMLGSHVCQQMALERFDGSTPDVLVMTVFKQIKHFMA